LLNSETRVVFIKLIAERSGFNVLYSMLLAESHQIKLPTDRSHVTSSNIDPLDRHEKIKVHICTTNKGNQNSHLERDIQ